MRYARKLTGLLLVVIAVALLAGEGRAQSEPDNEQGERPQLVFYQVSHGPVWRLDGQGNPHFDASVLIAHIKDHVAPGTWNDGAVIVPDPEKGALLVVQTRSNHDKIIMALRRLLAFAADDAADQLARNLADSRFSYQQVLLFVAEPSSGSSGQFLDARFDDDDEDLQKALANYRIQCVHRDETDLLDDRGLAAPSVHGATFAVLDPEGSLVAEAAFADLAPDRKLDRSLLLDFLETHRMELPNAKTELASGLAQAVREDKRVLVQVSGPNCGPCVLLSRYLESQEELIAKDYVYVKLDSRMPEATKVIGELRGARGPIPWMVILSSEGQTLITGDSEKGNIGCLRSETAKAHFEHMLRTTSQRLSDVEIGVILDGIGD